ncbi:MAG: patatin-like phospholipase family protein, partial [Pirellulales bacterium]|nr:patatin-like phospholipase family protein [Pirellulales bacterium]
NHSAEASLIEEIPLTGMAWHHVFLWSAGLGAWLILTALFVEPKAGGPEAGHRADLSADGTHPVLVTTGRLLGWLLYMGILEEAAWLLCAQGMFSFSLRAYALLSMVFVLMSAGVIAGSLDFLDGKLQRLPVRLIGIVVLLLLALLVRPRTNPGIEVISRDNNSEAGFGGSIYDDAYHHLELRIRHVPEEDPIVFVAASGGGSRAAIFSALVYEHLSRRPLEEATEGQDPRTWADNIVLISSVSGGSLATAQFVRHSCQASPLNDDLKYTIRDELVEGIADEIDRLIKQAKKDDHDEDWRNTKQRAEAIRAELKDLANPGKATWIVKNELTDEMCMNFMAPILRGTLSPAVFRGVALGSFWDHVFQWDQCTSLGGYDRDLDGLGPGYSPGLHPQVLFNSCNVDDGSRVVIGFPPLPDGAFDRESARQTRFPPQGLAFRFPNHFVGTSLSQAVRISSNFPWGFNPCVIDVQDVTDDQQESLQLIDGGVSDNTGIDSIFELVRGMARPDNERGHRILRLLQSRRIVL